MKSLLGKLENDTQSDETEREEDVFTRLNGQGVFDCRYPEYFWECSSDWSPQAGFWKAVTLDMPIQAEERSPGF